MARRCTSTTPGDGDLARARTPFAPIRDHVLLPFASALAEADAALRGRLSEPLLRDITAQVPEAWLGDVGREAYLAYLTARLAASSVFTEEAIRARAQHV